MHIHRIQQILVCKFFCIPTIYESNPWQEVVDPPRDQQISKTVRSFEEKPDYGQQRMITSTLHLILPLFFKDQTCYDLVRKNRQKTENMDTDSQNPDLRSTSERCVKFCTEISHNFFMFVQYNS